MNICVYGAASKSISAKHIENIEILGKVLGERGHTLVFGGGRSGAMGAVSRGAKYGGAKRIVGVIPKFLNVDGVLSENCTEVIYTEDMRKRKQLLEESSDAFIVAPGGVGTFDEFFEILSLKQLSRINKPIVIFNSLGYYNPLIALLDNAIEGNFMSEKNRLLYFATEDVNEVFEYLEKYDSSKTVKLAELKDVNFDINDRN